VSFASAALEDNIISYISFDDDQRNSTHLIDESVFGSVCALTGTTSFTDGVINASMDFASDYAICSNPASGQAVKTISFWFDSDDETSTQVISTFDTGVYTLILGEGGSRCSNEYLSLSDNTGLMTCFVDGSPTYDGGFHHFVAVWNATVRGGSYEFYLNGSKVTSTEGTDGDMPLITLDNIDIGARTTSPDRYFNGELDEFAVWNISLTPTQITELYNSGAGNNPFDGGTPPVTTPYAHLSLKDLYDNSSLPDGTNCYMGTDSNTSVSGVCSFYNHTSGLNYSVESPLYFTKTGTAVENATTDVYLYGANITLNVTDLLSYQVQNYTAHNLNQSAWSNTSVDGIITLILSPNSSADITIQAFDNNGTGGYNSTNQTYVNQTYTINTGLQDTGLYNLTGLYQAIIYLNVTQGTTSIEVTNYTSNLSETTNNLNYSQYTGENNNATFKVMWSNYSVSVDPDDYSISYKNFSMSAFNYSAVVVVPVYAINSFYLTFLDEITRSTITENMTLELISDVTAGTYNTPNGSLSLELLTPADYTLRYRSGTANNYTERDYYQTLLDNNYYDLNLYSLLNDESVDMVVTIKDTGGDPVEDASVKLLRYFTYCNCYEVVEMSKTSSNGESYFVVDEYDGHYKFAVEYNGATEFLSTSPENFVSVGGLVTRTITINLGSAYFESFRALTDVARTLTYNNATKGLSFTWNDPSGLVTRGCLYAEYLEGVHYTSVTPACLNNSVGSVVLTLNNSVASYKYYAELETSTTYSDYILFSGTIDKIVADLLNGNVGLGAFLGSGLIIVMALMFSFSAIAVLVITAVGVIGMGVLGIANLGTIFVTGFCTLILGIAAYLMRR